MQLVVCPGSFDPIHNGHVEIITRAAKTYGSVLVAVAHNSKKNYRFSLDERVQMVRDTFEYLDGVTVEALPPDVLLADFVRSKGSSLMVKGLRNVADFEYEAPMASMNRHISGVETSFVVGDPKWTHLSSTIVKEIAFYKGDVTAFVPRSVQKAFGQL
ncbi:pantetheine-phosphate adenylyltransferase [Rothia sp. ZJ932]|nr:MULTISPECIES: pantetheine-phosphate adenylyltransferase [unclassified Rothia (in: high G+C Gram-positive bacteria)]MBM7050929.1 pantetheine-phosphate adenylyltransferase [Rothia sp. ZJ1223]QRZ62571.1 pantetheine-phosphate adenylyltransferase [Rothia sp. ZJ932]